MVAAVWALVTVPERKMGTEPDIFNRLNGPHEGPNESETQPGKGRANSMRLL